jgi:hypothetical protein
MHLAGNLPLLLGCFRANERDFYLKENKLHFIPKGWALSTEYRDCFQRFIFSCIMVPKLLLYICGMYLTGI